MHAAILVLGDLGRSPRMQYHALALAERFESVDLIGYAGSQCVAMVENHPRLRVHRIGGPRLAGRQDLSRPAFFAAALWRLTVQSLRLGSLLLRIERPDLLLVQNPPAAPTLLLAGIAARLRGSRLIIDWHNLAYSVLGLRLGPDHLAVRAARWYERQAARFADGHLCVSQAMRAALAERLGVDGAVVLYDRPGPQFVPLDAARRAAELHRLAAELDWPDLARCAEGDERPMLLVNPTSWTADEDFDLLLDALLQCDGVESGRPLLVAVTGRGPLRELYEQRLRGIDLRHIQIRLLWLDPADYPLLLACADLGLCLHRSSSGVDLPMKVMDMFGAGVPVAALNYGPVVAEQVVQGENGFLFETSGDLARRLSQLRRGEKTSCTSEPGSTLLKTATKSFVDEWNAVESFVPGVPPGVRDDEVTAVGR